MALRVKQFDTEAEREAWILNNQELEPVRMFKTQVFYNDGED